MNANPNDPTRIAALARRAAKAPSIQPKLPRFPRISFEDALAYAQDVDRRDDQVQGYGASPAASVLDERNVWHLLSDGQEWLADVWVDDDGRYHIARDVHPGTGLPIERVRAVPTADVPELTDAVEVEGRDVRDGTPSSISNSNQASVSH